MMFLLLIFVVEVLMLIIPRREYLIFLILSDLIKSGLCDKVDLLEFTEEHDEEQCELADDRNAALGL